MPESPADYQIPDHLQHSALYSPDLAPIPPEARTWTRWNLAALWVGMAVCIPTYLLASYMIKSGLSWQAALIIIGLANAVITLPMVLNGQPGVKYGIPFPVVGRAAFGTLGIHLPSLLRGLVACGWFGVQTWIGGLSIYAIFNTITGTQSTSELDAGKFVAFGVFWAINIWFIWKGTESIKWLEDYSAPILIVIGLVLIGWGWKTVGGLGDVLAQSDQLGKPSVSLTSAAPTNHEDTGLIVHFNPLKMVDGRLKASKAMVTVRSGDRLTSSGWLPIDAQNMTYRVPSKLGLDITRFKNGLQTLSVQYQNSARQTSRMIPVTFAAPVQTSSTIWSYILWFTAMVGFWATMSISISDITRWAKTQADQVAGQFMGLPGTMVFYSFVGIFVTCAAIIAFPDVMISEDAPWDPVTLVAKFENPWVVVFAQVALLIATLSTNIAANVIAPANAIANLFPQKISFRVGGVLAGLAGIAICPWWLLDAISSLLLWVSGLLGPVLGILICDYFLINRKSLSLSDLYDPNGRFAGVRSSAMIALAGGVLVALSGYWIEALSFLYRLSWFSGFAVAFGLYYMLAPKSQPR